MSKLNRKGMVFSAVAVGAVLTLASAAFACTTFKGKATVANTDQTNNPGTSEARGNNSGMGYCSGYPTGGANAQVGDTVTVSVSPNPAGSCNTSQLADGTDRYRVNFVNYERQFSKGKYIDVPGFAISGSTYTWKADCMTPNNAGVVDLSGGFTFDVSGGSGTGTYTIPAVTTNPNNGGAVRANTPGVDASAICVSDNGAYTGNQIPLAIVV